MRWATYRGHAAESRSGLVRQQGDPGAGPAGHPVGDAPAGGSTMAEEALIARRRPAEVVHRSLGPGSCHPIQRPPSVRDFMAFENHVTAMTALNRTVDPVWRLATGLLLPPTPRPRSGPATTSRSRRAARPGTTRSRSPPSSGPGSNLSVRAAEAAIAGYTILVGWSARDLQSAEMSVGLGPAKGKDTATSFGPYLVTADELGGFASGGGYDLAMTATVNGDQWSSGSWADLHWTFGEMISLRLAQDHPDAR